MDDGANSYRRFLDGDENGMVEIIKDYKDGLILYLSSITGNIHIAEDLAEDVFVKLGTKKPRDKGKGSFKTWLYTIGRNIAVDYLRHSSRKAVVSIDDISELADSTALEQDHIKEERKIIIHKALKKLRPEYRQVIFLIYFEDCSSKEASVIMKKTVHGIETLVYRARAALRTELEKEGFTYEEL